jgi:hypothetical protein
VTDADSAEGLAMTSADEQQDPSLRREQPHSVAIGDSLADFPKSERRLFQRERSDTENTIR